MLDVFDKDLFHMGGDEVNLESWNRHPELNAWVVDRQKALIDLWKLFQTQGRRKIYICMHGKMFDMHDMYLFVCMQLSNG